MTETETNVYVVVEDRGDDGAVLVLYAAGDEIPAHHADLPRLAATFDAATSRWLPSEQIAEETLEPPPTRRRRGKPVPPETKGGIS